MQGIPSSMKVGLFQDVKNSLRQLCLENERPGLEMRLTKLVGYGVEPGMWSAKITEG